MKREWEERKLHSNLFSEFGKGNRALVPEDKDTTQGIKGGVGGNVEISPMLTKDALCILFDLVLQETNDVTILLAREVSDRANFPNFI